MTAPLDRRSALVGAGAALVAVGSLGGVFGLGVWWGGRSAEVATTEEPTHEPAEAMTEVGAAGEPLAVLTGATVEGGIVTVEIEYQHFRQAPDVSSSYHAHVYAADLAVETIGAPGDASVGGGMWEVVDGETVPLSEFLSQDAIEAGGVCVATATPMHTLAHLETNCVELES